MNKSKHHIKGNTLEQIVESIEKVILECNPTLKHANYSIERRKIKIIQGVRHEVDIYVRVNPGNGYDAIFLFECKNWDHKQVGKTPIIEFAEKIRVFGAQRGFFIAKGYSRYAIAQAALSERIQLCKARDFLNDNIAFALPTVQLTRAEQMKAIVEIKRNNLAASLDSISFGLNDGILLNGKPFDFQEEIRKHISHLFELKITELAQSTEAPTRTPFTFEEEVTYNMLQVGNEEARCIAYKIQFTFVKDLVYPRILNRIDIENRGKYLEFEYNDPERGIVRVALAAQAT